MGKGIPQPPCLENREENLIKKNLFYLQILDKAAPIPSSTRPRRSNPPTGHRMCFSSSALRRSQKEKKILWMFPFSRWKRRDTDR